MTNKVKEMTKEDEIYEAFMVLDKEKDDFISEKELKYFMRKVAHIKLSSEEAKAMIEFADNDGDGLINYDDFRSVIEMFQTQGAINLDNEDDSSQDDDSEDEESSEEERRRRKMKKKNKKKKTDDDE